MLACVPCECFCNIFMVFLLYLDLFFVIAKFTVYFRKVLKNTGKLIDRGGKVVLQAI